MTKQVSHSDPRTPVFTGTKRVPGLFEHTNAKGDTVFTARLRQDGGPPRRVTLDARNKTDAIRELEELRVDRRRGAPVRTGSLVPTVAEVTADFLAAMELRTHHRDPKQRRSPRTVALYRQRLEAHVLPVLGTRPIDEVTVRDLRRLIDKLGTKLAPSTTTAILVEMSAVWRYAVRQGVVERNVVRDLDRDDRPGVARQTEPRYLDAAEVSDLLAKMTDTFRPVAATCAYAGLRISEALGLTWADVDFSGKRIHVRRQLDPDLTIRNVTKTVASNGHVPLLPALERELRAHRSRQAEVGLARVRRDALVFTTAKGKPQSRRNALRAVHKAGDQAELNGKKGDGIEPVGLHDLRHSLVALALDSGLTLAEAAVLARHASARVTAQVYAGVSETAKAQIAGKLTAAGVGA
jgi:integrase